MEVRRSFSKFYYPPIPEEETFGLFPSTRNVYQDRRMFVPSSYELEARYKFKNSNYYTAPCPPKQALPRLQHEDPDERKPDPRPTSRYRRIQKGFQIAMAIRKSTEK